MKILRIRFKNLNSLVGEWDIDLTQPAFVSNGIFAITGPTGSGKTTILDAICLALYGQTPRLNKIAKSSNEIMSRQTGECFAEVVFETQMGRFRCHWSQHRSRKKIDGELQPPKHEISDADSGKILEAKVKGVAEQIEIATGMDFQRFTRSMLLVQGNFAAFLQASQDERSPILEQITGTEIYSKISIRVHERFREEREKLNTLQSETAGIKILEVEEENAIHHELEAKLQEETETKSKLSNAKNAVSWLTAIDNLKKELDALTVEAAELQNSMDVFKPDREKLDIALKAASLEESYASIAEKRKQLVELQTELKERETDFPKLESATTAQAESLQLAERCVNEAKEAINAAVPIIKQVRSLDQSIDTKHEAIRECKENYKKDEARINADEQTVIKEQKKLADAHEALEPIDNYLNENARDEWLVSGLTGIEGQLDGLRLKQKEIAQNEKDQKQGDKALKQTKKTLDDCQEQCGFLENKLDGVSQELQQEKDALSRLLGDRLLREYRSDKESLLREMAFLTTIAELEEHRARLEDGTPCPLCGATEHPYAKGNIPSQNETEKKIEALTGLIHKAEAHEASIKKFENAEAVAQKNLADMEKQVITADNNHETANKTLNDLHESSKKLQTDLADLKQAVAVKLQPLGINAISDADVTSLLDQLRERLNKWQSKIERKIEIEKQMSEFDSEIKRMGAVIETLRISLNDNRDRLGVLQKEHDAITEQRKALYGDKKPDAEEQRLNKSLADAEAAEKSAEKIYNDRLQKRNTAKEHLELLKQRIAQNEPELQKTEAAFIAALEAAGFSDEKVFQAARLTTKQKNELAAKAKLLDDAQTDLNARQKDRETRLALEKSKNVTDKPLSEHEALCKEYEESLQKLMYDVVALKDKLDKNIEAKKLMQEKLTVIELQQKDCRRWENLHELIGSLDGKKYRNFAQGLTFETLVGHANRQLQKMTARYLLVRDTALPLELNVIDNDQAGEIRSTKNLSGGESFIVSLSLALGLSHMSSKKVRVDSLFLDEGFGTLDEEALGTALEVLAGLQQDGKLIGIISHVPALKERIATQIQITPLPGGRSRITGPGCEKITRA